MLKSRVICLLTLYDGVLFRTKKFIADYRYTLNFVNLDFDEVVLVDLGGDRRNFFRTLRDFTDECFVPVTVGGGISSLDDVSFLMSEFPVDKILIGPRLTRELGKKITDKWGRQILVAGLTKGKPAPDLYHCGEILCQSVERDGSLQGYDIPWISSIAKAYEVPVIAGSGCGTWKHMQQAFEAGASGAATSVIHHFPRNALKGCKSYLLDRGVAVRP